jgi:outer membrane receptor protein involved in Fe transport
MKASRHSINLCRQAAVLMLAVAAFVPQTNAQESGTLLEEIIVVGTKAIAGADVQEAPYAITALTDGYLEEAGIKDVFDMQQNVPGLIVGQSQTATTSNFSIRGIGTSSNNFGLESSVGLYVDGVYRSRQSSMINDLIDIETVEVFRGPQGTLFGKNTPQGAIQLLTKKPNPDDPDAFVELTAGDFGLVKLSAATSFALSENTAMRLTLSSTQRDGYVSDISFGEEVLNDRDRYGMRLQLYSTPSDRLDIRIIADYAEIDEVCCVAVSRVDGIFAKDFVDPVGNPNTFGLVLGPDAWSYMLGGTIFTSMQDSDSLANGMTWADGQLLLAGVAASLSLPGGTFVSGIPFDEYLVAVNELPRSTAEDAGLSVELNYDLNNGAQLTSITGYRSFDTFDSIDADFTNVPALQRINVAQQSSLSQELRIAKNFDNGGNFVAGVYYFTQDLDNQKETNGGPALGGFVGLNEQLLILGAGLVDLASGLDAALGDGTIQPAGVSFPSTVLGDSSDSFSTDTMVQEHDSWAVFGQFDIPLGDKFIVTLGARYTEEDKTMLGSFSQGAQGPPIDLDALALVGCQLDVAVGGLGIPQLDDACNGLRFLESQGVVFPLSPSAPISLVPLDPLDPTDPANIAAFILAPFAFDGWGTYRFDPLAPRGDLNESLKDDQLTGTAKLTWRPTDTTMFYASYGTGYKSGGTNTDRIDTAFNPVFQAETSESIEIGAKLDFPAANIRLNIAIYDTQVDDLQANSFTGTGFNLQNAGKADTSGGEIEFWWYPSDTFTIQAFYARSKADFESFEDGTCWDAFTFHTGTDDPGLQPPDPTAPPSLLPSERCRRTGDRIAYNPEDRFFLGLTKDFRLGGSTTLFVRGEYSYASDLFTDGDIDPLTLQDSLSLYNLRLGLRFENADAELALWGRNLSDDRYYAGSFDPPIQDGRMNSYPAEPRTYGLTFRKHF